VFKEIKTPAGMSYKNESILGAVIKMIPGICYAKQIVELLPLTTPIATNYSCSLAEKR